MFWVWYSIMARISKQPSACNTWLFSVSRLFNRKLGNSQWPLWYCCRHENALSFSLPVWHSTLYCYRPSSQLAPQYFNVRNIKGSFPTHQRMGFSVSTSEVTCSREGKMNQMLSENCLWWGILQNPNREYLPSTTSLQDSYFTQQTEEQNNSSGCVYLLPCLVSK